MATKTKTSAEKVEKLEKQIAEDRTRVNFLVSAADERRWRAVAGVEGDRSLTGFVVRVLNDHCTRAK